MSFAIRVPIDYERNPANDLFGHVRSREHLCTDRSAIREEEADHVENRSRLLLKHFHPLHGFLQDTRLITRRFGAI
jgi:hypothetical protein